MKLVVLYGPPGVGKLTVGKALAKKTGYKLFHNHLMNDLLQALFEFETASFHRLSRLIRTRTLIEASRHGLPGVIFTYVYAKKDDDKELRNMKAKLRSQGIRFFWVQLRCKQTVLERRVRHVSRKRHRKIKSVLFLRKLQQRYNLDSAVPFKPNLVLDISKLPPAFAAQRIIKHFKL